MRWEYLELEAVMGPGIPSMIEKANALGAEGWELVAFRGLQWIFKRPVPQQRRTLDEVNADYQQMRAALNFEAVR